MTDAEVIAGILAGDTGKFEVLVDRYLTMVRGLCGGHIYNSSARDDVVQETFIDGYLKLAHLRRRDRFGQWLAAIARHKCKTWLRGENRRGKAHGAMVSEPVPDAPSPLGEMARDELYEFVHRRIKALPDKTREAMMLCYVEGLGVREAAVFLGVREAAVKKRLQYGRQLISGDLLQALAQPDSKRESEDRLKKLVMGAAPLSAAPLKMGLGSAALSFAASKAVWFLAPATVAVVAVAGPRIANSIPSLYDAKTETAAPTSSQDLSASSPAPPSVPEVPENKNAMRAVTVTLRYRPPNATEPAPPVPNANVLFVPLVPKEDWLRKNAQAAGMNANDLSGVLRLLQFGQGKDQAGTEAAMAALDKLRASANPQLSRDNFAKALLIPAEENSWRRTTASPEGVARTDLPDGVYTLHAWPPGALSPQERYGFKYEGPGYMSMGVARITVGPGKPVDCVVELEDTLSEIHGSIVDEAGKTVQGFVTLTGEVAGGKKPHYVTLPDGGFRFTAENLGYGKFTLSVSVSARQGRYYPAEPIEGVREFRVPSPDYILRVKPYASVYGVVHMADGRPAPRIDIMRETAGKSGDASNGARTDANGCYTFYHDGGDFSMYAYGLGGARSETVEFHLDRDQSIKKDYVLPPTTELRFYVKNERGETPEKIELGGRGVPSNGHSFVGFPFFPLRRQGLDAFVLPYVAAGEYSLRISARGYNPEKIRGLVVQVGEKEKVFRITLKAATETLSVRVLDPDGAPVSGYTVGVTQTDDEKINIAPSAWTVMGDFTPIEAVTDANGQCVVDGLSAGAYKVGVNCQPLPGTYSPFNTFEQKVAVPHDGMLTIQLPSPPVTGAPSLTKLDLEVTDAQNQNRPVSTEQASCYLLSGNEIGMVCSNPGGTFLLLSPVPSAKSTIVFVKPGFTAGIQTVEITPGQKAVKVPMALGPSGGVCGRIQDAEGNPAPNQEIIIYPAVVDASQPDAQHLSTYNGVGRALAQGARTGADGAFRLNYLPAGEYWVGLPSRRPAERVTVRAGSEAGPVVITDYRIMVPYRGKRNEPDNQTE